MRQDLTESERKRIKAFHKRGLDYPHIAAEIVVGRHLMEFVHLQGEIEAYFKELGGKEGIKNARDEKGKQGGKSRH